MADKRVLDVIRTAAQECGTPASVVEAVIGHLLPGIRLVPRREEGEPSRLGGSRIGGLPDLPPTIDWPPLSSAPEFQPVHRDRADSPLQFLMQLDLAEMAAFDVRNVLPKRGLLSFFFYPDYDTCRDVGRVLFVQDPASVSRREPPSSLPPQGRYRELALEPRLEWTVPTPEDLGLEAELALEHADWWADIEDRLVEVQGLPSYWKSLAPVHRFLGYPQLLQADSLGEGYRLLLQVSSDCPSLEHDHPKTGMMWGDVGRVYYCLPAAALTAYDFEASFAFHESQ
jgi:uncharacterized protein YwqG